MIESSIEVGKLDVVLAEDVNPSELVIPSLGSLTTYLVKIPMWNLCCKILISSLTVDCRNCHLDHDILGATSKRENGSNTVGFNLSARLQDLTVMICQTRGDWSRELHHKEDALILGPALAVAVPFDSSGTNELESCAACLVSMTQINDNVRRIKRPSFAAIAVHTYALAGCKFCTQVVVCECNSVISWLRGFICVTVA